MRSLPLFLPLSLSWIMVLHYKSYALSCTGWTAATGTTCAWTGAAFSSLFLDFIQQLIAFTIKLANAVKTNKKLTPAMVINFSLNPHKVLKKPRSTKMHSWMQYSPRFSWCFSISSSIQTKFCTYMLIKHWSCHVWKNNTCNTKG